MAGDRWRVLVVDDEADLRELIRLTLSFDDRIEVVAAVSDAEQALRAVAEAEAGERIDLVVLDHWLGGPLTGVEVATRLHEQWPQTKIVLFTAIDDVEIDLRDGSPVDAILTKPELVRLPEVAHRVMRD